MLKELFLPHYHFEAHETLIAFRYKMLKIMTVVLALFTLVFGLLDIAGLHQMGLLMRYTEFGMSGLAVGAYILLSRYKKAYFPVLYFLMAVTFAFFTVTLFTVPEDSFRAVWFLVLIIGVFVLHSIVAGLVIASVSLGMILAGSHMFELQMNQMSLTTMSGSFIIITITLFFYTRRINEYEEQLLEKNRILDRLATHDALTGVMNRRLFLNIANKYFHKALREKQHLYFLMMDIDWFKKINDTYGHKIGDDVLITYTGLIASILRKNDLFGRLGGEEFGIAIMEESMEHAKMAAEKIRNEVAKHRFPVDDTELSITVSIGIATSDTHKSLEETMHFADKAMYDAKASGRNCIKTEADV